MFKISEKANPNYLSQIVRLDNIVPHPNADRLQIAVIQEILLLCPWMQKKETFMFTFL